MDTITTILQAQLDTANESLTSLNNKLIEVNNELNNVNANIDTVTNQISSINASLAAIQDPTVSTVLNTAMYTMSIFPYFFLPHLNLCYARLVLKYDRLLSWRNFQLKKL